MTNCLEWLPVYFGILKSGALAAPLNFRFDAGTIARCLETADANVLIFGEEFIDRIRSIKPDLDRFVQIYIFVGSVDVIPEFAVPNRQFVTAAKADLCLDEKSLSRFCEALPRYKRPRKFFLDDVPRNPTGKIEKPELRNKFAGKTENCSFPAASCREYARYPGSTTFG